MATVKKILTVEQVAEIDKSLRDLHDVMPVLDAAGDCGIDCQAMKDERKSMVEKLSKMKEYFG